MCLCLSEWQGGEVAPPHTHTFTPLPKDKSKKVPGYISASCLKRVSDASVGLVWCHGWRQDSGAAPSLLAHPIPWPPSAAS